MWGNKNLIGEGSEEREAYEMETEMDNSFELYSKSSYYVSGVEWCTVLGIIKGFPAWQTAGVEASLFKIEKVWKKEETCCLGITEAFNGS